MLQLFNYCPMPKEYDNHTEDLQGFLQKNNLYGMELFLYSKEYNSKALKPWVKGVHLRYWPYWLDFWQGHEEKLCAAFGDAAKVCEYYWGATGRDEWLEIIRNHIRLALTEHPEYLVWHVANSDLHETFTFDFQHTDTQVTQATAAIFNAVADCIPADVCVLFENLWWPGLRLTEQQVVADFFAAIKRDNCGIMLDIGHLLNTNPQLANEEQGYAYAQTIIENLGVHAKKIRGVHLNYSLSGEYIRNLDKIVPQRFDAGNIYEHITQIDQHRPCEHPALAALIKLIKPEYLVHELFYDNLVDLQNKLNLQQKALQGYNLEE